MKNDVEGNCIVEVLLVYQVQKDAKLKRALATDSMHIQS